MKRNIVAKLVLVLLLMASVAAVLLPLRKASGFPSHGTSLLREAEPRAIATSDRSPVRQSLAARKLAKPHRTSAVQAVDKLKFVGQKLAFGAFILQFDSGGTFILEGRGWASVNGNWKIKDNEIELTMSGGPGGCDGPGRYQFSFDGKHLSFNLVADDCRIRRMILDRSTWGPAGEIKTVQPRRITRTSGSRPSMRVNHASSVGSWPSFRGPQASGVAENQNLPDQWNGKTGENILWKTPIPGLAHSSPIVWGDRVFVTSAVSSDPKATFRPGLYGDGDASQDRSRHRWMIYALDRRSGKILWERIAHEGEPREKRHIKATYANSTPATDGRIVVAWFGSHGVHAYDVKGRFLWKVDLGRVDFGAYDIPTFEWGSASSPIIWKVIPH